MHKVEVPDFLSHLPRDVRGYPVFFSVFVKPDGTPDFRVIDERKRVKCIRDRRCGLCGKTLGLRLTFVGGPKSVGSRTFADPPMHPACADYAQRTCPFLSLPKARYREFSERDEAAITQGGAEFVTLDVSTDHPDRFGLVTCSAYALVNDGLYFRPLGALEVEWREVAAH